MYKFMPVFMLKSINTKLALITTFLIAVKVGGDPLYLRADKKMLAAFLSLLAGTLLMAGLVVWWLLQFYGNNMLVSR